jgi:hypothetical protein
MSEPGCDASPLLSPVFSSRFSFVKNFAADLCGPNSPPSEILIRYVLLWKILPLEYIALLCIPLSDPPD